MLEQLLRNALAAAQADSRNLTGSAIEVNRARSKAWVSALGRQFAEHYQGYERIKVFWQQNEAHRGEFRLNELLHDVAVVEVESVDSAAQGKALPLVTRGLWQVESELARDSREALLDFNKLTLGSAQNKLFIGPQVADPAAFRDVLRQAAARCAGEVFCAFIPHPSQWNEGDGEVEVFGYLDHRWVPWGEYKRL